MEHRIEFHEDYIEITVWGKASLEGFLDYVVEGLGMPQWRAGMNVLTDLSGAESHDTENISFDDSNAFASFVAKNARYIGNSKLATIPAGNTNSRMLVRLFENLSKFYGSPIDHRIVMTRKEALDWFHEE